MAGRNPTKRQKRAVFGMSDADLVKFAAEFRSGILGRQSSFCMCWAVCAPLTTLLEMHGVACRLAQSDLSDGPYAVANHFWIELDDGRVLDPTADQFLDEHADDEATLLPPVYLGKPLAFHADGPASPPALSTSEG